MKLVGCFSFLKLDLLVVPIFVAIGCRCKTTSDIESPSQKAVVDTMFDRRWGDVGINVNSCCFSSYPTRTHTWLINHWYDLSYCRFEPLLCCFYLIDSPATWTKYVAVGGLNCQHDAMTTFYSKLPVQVITFRYFAGATSLDCALQHRPALRRLHTLRRHRQLEEDWCPEPSVKFSFSCWVDEDLAGGFNWIDTIRRRFYTEILFSRRYEC